MCEIELRDRFAEAAPVRLEDANRYFYGINHRQPGADELMQTVAYLRYIYAEEMLVNRAKQIMGDKK